MLQRVGICIYVVFVFLLYFFSFVVHTFLFLVSPQKAVDIVSFSPSTFLSQIESFSFFFKPLGQVKDRTWQLFLIYQSCSKLLTPNLYYIGLQRVNSRMRQQISNFSIFLIIIIHTFSIDHFLNSFIYFVLSLQYIYHICPHPVPLLVPTSFALPRLFTRGQPLPLQEERLEFSNRNI